MSDEAQVTRLSLLSMQVCIPACWTDEQAIDFAEQKNPCGTTSGWGVRKSGSDSLKGDPERNPCSERAGFVHVMLDA